MSGVERHTIACIVDDESGALARVVGLFSGRGYNIESLTVAVVNSKKQLSRITLVPSGTQMVYKIQTFNQSSGSKETAVKAVSLGWK